MSFSITVIGKPDAIKRRLAEESARLNGQSKEEFDAIKPAIDAVLDQQVGNGCMRVSANGHASFEGEGETRKKTYGTCTVEIQNLGQIAE